jgi:hypothetical protein
LTAVLNKQIAAETQQDDQSSSRPRHAKKLGVTSVPDLVRISQRAGVSPSREPA